MARLMVLGVSPLPFEITDRSFGPGTRTWQLTQPLLDDGHQVQLIAMRIPNTYPEDVAPELVQVQHDLSYTSITQQLYFESRYVQDRYDEYQPDAVVFAHASASFVDWILDPKVPVWIDLCGHVMAEAQAKAAVYRDDSFLDYFFHRYVNSLYHGDAFSTVSEAQRWALIGELGLAGRLNSQTNGHNLVHVIPCGVEEKGFSHDANVLRGIDVDDDAFVVLWSGGFNTWTDVGTLFEGLVYAMSRDDTVHFVATGGQIDGHDEKTYPRFVEMVEASPYRERFIFKGWLPRDLVHNYYFEADVGINCEKDIYEVRLGSKHRILDWSRAALPVVSTRVTELSAAIEADGVGFVCEPGSAEALGHAILDAVAKRSELDAIGERCQIAMRRRYGFAASTKCLRAWAQKPAFAPDRGRVPTCLQGLVVAGSSAVESTEMDDDIVVPTAGTDKEMVPWASNPIDTDAADAPALDESRTQWLRRVARNSYRDGGLGLVMSRAWEKLRGRGSTSLDR